MPTEFFKYGTRYSREPRVSSQETRVATHITNTDASALYVADDLCEFKEAVEITLMESTESDNLLTF